MYDALMLAPGSRSCRSASAALMLVLVCAARIARGAPASSADSTGTPASSRWSSFLPFMGDMARKHGVELPLPFGAGLVYYHLARDIEISDVRVGTNGAAPVSVSNFANLGSTSNVENLNLKLDVWLLPFVNVYGIVGYIWNSSDTRIDVTVPPLLPGGTPRQLSTVVPTAIEGTVGGVGMTLAGGYGAFFITYDVNLAQADLGFDDRFRAVVTSIRGGWNGRAADRPLRTWLSVTDWNTFATATGTVVDSDGGTLSFEVDQGPRWRYTYGAGAQYSYSPRLELAVDSGSDFHGGWYLALVPVFRF